MSPTFASACAMRTRTPLSPMAGSALVPQTGTVPGHANEPCSGCGLYDLRSNEVRRALRLALSGALLLALAAACVSRDGVVPTASIIAVSPASGGIGSGTTITIEGTNFSRLKGAEAGSDQDINVLVCGVPLSEVQLDVRRERTVVLPPASNAILQIGDEITGVLVDGASAGLSDVIVSLAGGQQLVLEDAFECVQIGRASCRGRAYI